MHRDPSRRALVAVRAVQAASTTALAGVAIVLALGGATANTADLQPVESDVRCEGAAGKTIVRTLEGATKAVPFEHGWKVYRGKRPGDLVVVCPA